ncbi:MAG: MFS transporter [Oscillospiraceae bacterium]|nr:MFS transporter [Oscillospiraceae bacterium]
MATEKVWSKPFITIVVANFIFCFGFYALEPTLPLYVSSLGATDTQVGLVATGFFFAAIVTRIFLGFLVDKVGRKAMLRTGAVISVVFMLLYLLTAASLGATLVRILQGVGYGMVTTMFGSIAADILPDSRRGEGIGYLSMSTTGAVAFSPAVALAIVNHVGFRPMFLSAAFAMLLAAICTFFLRIPENTLAAAGPDGAPAKPEKLPVWRKFYDPRVSIPAVLLMLYGICRVSEQNFIPLLAKQEALTVLSVFFVIKTWVCFGSKFLTAKIYDRKGPSSSIIPGGAAMAICMLLLSMTHTNAMLLVTSVFSGIALGMIIPAFQAFVMDLVGRNQRSLGNALFYNFLDIGTGIGGVIMGSIANHAGYFNMFRFGMILMILYLIIYSLSAVRRKHKTA